MADLFLGESDIELDPTSEDEFSDLSSDSGTKLHGLSSSSESLDEGAETVSPMTSRTVRKKRIKKAAKSKNPKKKKISVPKAQYHWQNTEQEPPVFEFTKQSGLVEPLDDCNEPIDFFHKFYTLSLENTIIDETNKYAREQSRSKSGRPRVSLIDSEELGKFLGLCLHMGIVGLPSLIDYWSTDPLLKVNCFAATMPRDRFLSILSSIHFADNTTDDGQDPIFKIRPVVAEFLRASQSLYYPSRELSIAESAMLGKGRLSFRTYLKNKKHRSGMKLYVLSEATGYIANILIYHGASTSSQSHAYAVIMKLMESYLDSGHALYLIKQYTSVAVAKALVARNTYVTGTLASKRHGNPLTIVGQTKKLKAGEATWSRCGDVVVIKWMDKKPVLMISTEFSHQMVLATSSHDGQQLKIKPLAVSEYSKYMNGVEKCAHTMLSYYECLCKGLKWYRRLFFHLLDMMMWNAYVLYKLKFPEKCITLLQFRLEVARSLICVPDLESHTAAAFPATLSNEYPRRRCRVCLVQDVRSDTRYYCKQCPENPPLCYSATRTDCWNMWHSKT